MNNSQFATFTPLTLIPNANPNEISNYYSENNIIPDNPYMQKYLSETNETPVAKTSDNTNSKSIWNIPALTPSTTSNLNFIPINQRAKTAMQFLMNKGLSKAQSAGIVGNLQSESSLDPTAVGDKNLNTPSEGVAQWREERLTNLKNFAKAQNKPYTDFNTQLAFLWNELNSSKSSALNALRATTTPQEAASIFAHKFEVMKTYNKQREINANNLFNEI